MYYLFTEVNSKTSNHIITNHTKLSTVMRVTRETKTESVVITTNTLEAVINAIQKALGTNIPHVATGLSDIVLNSKNPDLALLAMFAPEAYAIRVDDANNLIGERLLYNKEIHTITGVDLWTGKVTTNLNKLELTTVRVSKEVFRIIEPMTYADRYHFLRTAFGFDDFTGKENYACRIKEKLAFAMTSADAAKIDASLPPEIKIEWKEPYIGRVDRESKPQSRESIDLNEVEFYINALETYNPYVNLTRDILHLFDGENFNQDIDCEIHSHNTTSLDQSSNV